MLRHIVKLSLKTCEQQTVSRVINVQLYSKCNYGRWTHRKPVAILNEDELYEEENAEEEPKQQKTQPKKVFPKKQKKESAAGEKTEDVITETKKGFPSFETLKENDKIISSLMIQVKSRKRRKKNNLIFLEGYRLINDCIEAGEVPEVVMFSRTSDLMKLSLSNFKAKVYKVPYRTIQLWSNLETSPGIMAVFPTPNVHEKEPAPDALPFTIICDNVREPGNLGSILRAAAGVGCERVILAKGCVDLWEPKVLRSAAGAHFRMPISVCDEYEDILSLISPDSQIYMADNNVTFEDKDISETVASSSDDTQDGVQEGNEMDEVKVNDSKESTDAQRSEDKEGLSTEEELIFLEEKLFATQQSNYNLDQLKEVFSKKGFVFTKKAKQILKRLTVDLPVIPYYAVDYTKNEVVLIISGETEGLSFPSLELLHKKDGVRVNVPLTNGVESLNSGVALGVVAFEIKRQFLQRMTK